jgi:putative ABC transport system ATP-binding protein
MHINLQNIIPQPLAEQYQHNPQSSEVWLQNITLQQGKKYAMQAQSGKGKSTFLHILYGLRQDFQGEVLFEKTNIRTYKPENWAFLRQQKIAVVFQDLRLFLHLTAEENILAKAYLTQAKPDKPKIYAMAERLQISHLLKSTKKTQFFSYGERQRIAILRALQQPFEWILLDEPFSHLDAENVKLASELINEACQTQGAGFVLTSLGYDYPLAYDETLKL